MMTPEQMNAAGFGVGNLLSGTVIGCGLPGLEILPRTFAEAEGGGGEHEVDGKEAAPYPVALPVHLHQLSNGGADFLDLFDPGLGPGGVGGGAGTSAAEVLVVPPERVRLMAPRFLEQIVGAVSQEVSRKLGTTGAANLFVATRPKLLLRLPPAGHNSGFSMKIGSSREVSAASHPNAARPAHQAHALLSSRSPKFSKAAQTDGDGPPPTGEPRLASVSVQLPSRFSGGAMDFRCDGGFSSRVDFSSPAVPASQKEPRISGTGARLHVDPPNPGKRISLWKRRWRRRMGQEQHSITAKGRNRSRRGCWL